MARPRIKIDPKAVESLAAQACTNEEIAAALEVSADTLTRRFADSINRGKLKGHVSIKRSLFQQANKGNMTAIVWFMKCYMGMSNIDKPTIDVVTPVKDLVSEFKKLKGQ